MEEANVSLLCTDSEQMIEGPSVEIQIAIDLFKFLCNKNPTFSEATLICYWSEQQRIPMNLKHWVSLD